VATGKLAALAKLLTGLTALMLPKTPPALNQGTERSTIKEKLGLGALVLLENKMLKVYFITTLVLTIPLAAFYLYTPKLLMELSALDHSSFAVMVQQWLPGPSAQMTLGQMTEIGAMLCLLIVACRMI